MLPDNVKIAQEKLKPEKYAEFLKEIDLNNIVLKNVRCALLSEELTGSNSFIFEEKTNLVANDVDHAILEVSYKLTAKSGRKRIATVTAKYGVVFVTKCKLPTEFYDIFGHFSLPLHSFPYFRECVNSLFSRMGLPPLIMPLRKFLVGEPMNKGKTKH